MKKKCCLVTNIMDSVSDYQQKLNRLERIKTSQYGPKTKQEFKESRNYLVKVKHFMDVLIQAQRKRR